MIVLLILFVCLRCKDALDLLLWQYYFLYIYIFKCSKAALEFICLFIHLFIHLKGCKAALGKNIVCSIVCLLFL